MKYREMVIIGILAFRGRKEGVIAHMRRAIEHGATKRELLEAIQSAAVPGGGPTFSTGAQALDGAGPRGGVQVGSASLPPLAPEGERDRVRGRTGRGARVRE